MIAAIVVPLGCLSRPRTASCLVPPPVGPEALANFAGFFARLVGAIFTLRVCCGVPSRFVLEFDVAQSPAT
jgi:hypothetical protein